MGYGDGSFQIISENKVRHFLNYTCDLDGKVYRLSVYGKNNSECRQKMKEAKRKKDDEVRRNLRHSADSRSAILQSALLDWLKREKFGKVKASTYDRNERTIMNHIYDTDFGREKAIKVTSKEISSFLDELLTKHSESSVKKVYELLGQFYRFYYAEDINNNPMNKVARPQKKNIGEVEIGEEVEERLEDLVLNDEEIEKFRAQVFLPPKKGVAGRPKHGVDLFFIMMTVVRFGEAAALTWGDIDEEKRVMYVRRNQSIVTNRDGGEGGKTKRILTTPKNGKAWEVMLSKNALEALAEIKKRSRHTDKNDFVICSDSGKSLTNHNLRKTLDGVMKVTGLSRPGFGLHYLRHTGISYYIRHGIPLEMVSKMAGHSSVAITEKVYYHIIHEQQQKMLEMMDEI